MADEFAVGFGFLSGAGLLWMIFGGIYKTPSFQEQLGTVVENPPDIGIPPDLGVFLADLFMALMILGPIVFWVAVPLAKWVVVKRRRKVKAEASAE
ncbi:MAG: hypothetical protein SXQ77_03985 [Halobacteria archaeon]|nr:hypothetical protein [Halobacteria archaeon]